MVKSSQPDTFRVSRSTARVLGNGHPWILPDAESDDPARFRPGSRVRVLGPTDRELGWARIEGPGRIAARMWARAGSSPRDDGGEVWDRVQAALARREPLAARGSARNRVNGRIYTDALRLIHGEADGLPGLTVDRLGPLLRVGVWGGACADLLGPVVNALRKQLDTPEGGIWPVVEVRSKPLAVAAGQAAVSWREPPPPSWMREHVGDQSRVKVWERGLCFEVDPGLSAADHPRPGVGLFLDQRENRARLARRARRGGTWLNLFAHTGSFSLALLAGGAEQVRSVDLSAAYLRWLEGNLELNREELLDASRHVSIRQDGRRYLASLPRAEQFAGIVLDPPTAASAGRRFWSIRRDLEPLVGECLKRL
ncbi:MAG: class I SAM-dependent methyltransferase, partial [Myxococcota bacterium]